jgi:hypothetical protein
MVVDHTVPAQRHIVVLVHGIRTFGAWQERLAEMLRRRNPAIASAGVVTAGLVARSSRRDLPRRVFDTEITFASHGLSGPADRRA